MTSIATSTVLGIEGARQVRGVAVVIDVMRAFTTAAYAFAAGASEIHLVATVDEAFALPGFRMGEVGGRLIPGFDHNNSPSGLVGRRLSGPAVLRSGNGTQCVLQAAGATEIWLGSLVVASATARALSTCGAVTFVASGAPAEGEEDIACAEWMTALLAGGSVSADHIVSLVRGSRAARKHQHRDRDFPLQDVDCAVALDAFNFAMRAERHGSHWIAKAVYPDASPASL